VSGRKNGQDQGPGRRGKIQKLIGQQVPAVGMVGSRKAKATDDTTR
jgi:hypothetical protein